MAGVLFIGLAGPSMYEGVFIKKLHIDWENNTGYQTAALHVIRIVRFASLCGFFIAIIVQLSWTAE